MKLTVFSQKIRELLRQDHFDIVLELLNQILIDSTRQNELNIIARQYVELKTNRRKGIIDEATRKLGINQIHQSILSLVDDLPRSEEASMLEQRLHDLKDSDFVVEPTTDRDVLFQKRKKLPAGFYYLVVTGLIIIFAIIFGDSKINMNWGDGIINQGNLDPRQERFERAFEQVSEELNNNFMQSSSLIYWLSITPPEEFTDVHPPAPNTLPPTYAAEGRTFYNTYLTHIWEMQESNAPEERAFQALFIDLSYNTRILKNLEKSYENQRRIQRRIQSFVQQSRSRITPKTGPADIYPIISRQHEMNLIELRITFATSIEAYLLTLDQIPEVNSLSGYLRTIGIQAQANTLKELLQETRNGIRKLIQEKNLVIEKQMPIQGVEKLRKVNPKINDPYLIEMRRIGGLPDTLSPPEIWSLEHSQPLTVVTNFSDLLTQAHLSFATSDGSLAAYYLEKALRTKQDSLGHIHREFLQWSLKRIADPYLFDGAIGLMVVGLQTEVETSTNFQVGDIIYKLDNETINSVEQIRQVCHQGLKGESHQFSILRNGIEETVEVKGKGLLGIEITSLIMFYSALC